MEKLKSAFVVHSDHRRPMELKKGLQKCIKVRYAVGERVSGN